MKRTGIFFLSVPLPEDLVLKIREWKELVRAGEQVRWGREDKLHITLLFLGQLERELLEEIEASVGSVLQEFRSFDVQVGDPGIKKLHNRKKNMLWLKVENSPDLDRLHLELKRCLSAYANFREGGFRPHITLARHADKSFRIPAGSVNFEHRFWVESVELMESDRTGKETKYVVKKRFLLGG